MTNHSKFPFLHLPQLAIDEVLSTMVPLELFNISNASRQCKLIIKTFSKNRIHKNYGIILKIDRNAEIRFSQNRTNYSFTLTGEIEKDDTRHSFVHDRIGQCETLYVYSDAENLTKECIQFFMNITEIFNVGVNLFLVYLNQFKELHPTFLDWLNTNFQTIDKLEVHVCKETVAHLEKIMNNLTIIKKVHIASRKSGECAYNIPDHFESVIISHGGWVKLEQLFSFKASQIHICNSELTNADLNVFLKSWVNMECNQNLKSLEVEMLNPDDMETVFQGVPHTIGNPDRTAYRGPDRQQLDGGVDIKRQDGLSASLFVYQVYHWFLIIMTTQLANYD